MIASTLASTLFSIGMYDVRSADLWIVGTAVLCCVACALPGCFLVLRRMALLGDAISHAILPGLALAFLLTQSRAPVPMLIGALVVGVLTAFLTSGLTRWARVPEDASMGVVFSSMFALGVILITWAARGVDLDPGCVLYGLIEFVPFDTVAIGGMDVPRSFAWLLVVLAINAGMIGVFFKELRIVCFDAALATTMGISATVVHYGLMTLVAGTAVASFEAAGSILVVAMLVAPGATAHLLTDRLGTMLWIAAGTAAFSAVLGYAGAVALDTSVAGMIASVSLAVFVLAALLAPRHGILAKQLHRLDLAVRIRAEDLLADMYRAHEAGAAPVAATGCPAASGWLGRLACRRLRRRGLARAEGSRLAATPAGLYAAQRLVRAHRLWETFLADRLGRDPGLVHEGAHRAEHFLSGEIQDLLEADEPARDPHGKPIPPKS
jgi:manganese/zinc/iron transport system permease protein